eukprot:jgi/Chrzof1/12946/Cz07g13150.t1
MAENSAIVPLWMLVQLFQDKMMAAAFAVERSQSDVLDMCQGADCSLLSKQHLLQGVHRVHQELKAQVLDDGVIQHAVTHAYKRAREAAGANMQLDAGSNSSTEGRTIGGAAVHMAAGNTTAIIISAQGGIRQISSSSSSTICSEDIISHKVHTGYTEMRRGSCDTCGPDDITTPAAAVGKIAAGTAVARLDQGYCHTGPDEDGYEAVQLQGGRSHRTSDYSEADLSELLMIDSASDEQPGMLVTDANHEITVPADNSNSPNMSTDTAVPQAAATTTATPVPHTATAASADVIVEALGLFLAQPVSSPVHTLARVVCASGAALPPADAGLRDSYMTAASTAAEPGNAAVVPVIVEAIKMCMVASLAARITATTAGSNSAAATGNKECAGLHPAAAASNGNATAANRLMSHPIDCDDDLECDDGGDDREGGGFDRKIRNGWRWLVASVCRQV